jgi:hypothetical protein
VAVALTEFGTMGVDTESARSYHPSMPMWRCPHCATPQAETARCWVCHRSSTACGSCRHFRRSVAAQIGYCGLDRQRQPLRGDEIRGCWEPGDAAGATAASTRPTLGPAADWALEPGEDRTPVRLRDFIEVRAGSARGADHPPDRNRSDEIGEPPPASLLGVTSEPRWSLWGDAEA